jgi:hypothetical protein
VPTPATLRDLTVFIDALVRFDRLYCIANPIIDVSLFNRRLGADVLMAIPDPDGGVLRRLAAHAAANGLSEMESLRWRAARSDDAWRQEVHAVADGWRGGCERTWTEVLTVLRFLLRRCAFNGLCAR